MSPKILVEKNKERENRVSEEKERKRRKKKAMTALLVFFFLLLFESPISAATLFKNLALIYVFLTPVPNTRSDLKRIYFKI